MRKYGEIDGVYFVFQGFSIWNLAYEYKLSYDCVTILTYANTMKELKQEINKFRNGEYNE